MSGVEYRILGSLEALRDGRQLPLGGSKQRAVLAFLLMRANRVATTDELIEALWPTSPPGRPQTAIQGYVSQLRKTLDPAHPFEVIVTEPAGYRLHVGPDDLDLFRLESLLRRGRDALDQNRAEVAASAFRDALSLYRGPPLADFNYESWAQSDIGRLDELRHTSVEERIEADLRLGRHGELVGEIEGLVAEHPLRERMRAHQMLALYRSGRQSEALAAYQDARQVLVEQFGIDPTRALQELERKILLQDPSLDFEPTARGLSETVGELTLLLTDIEGSTRLVHRLGSDYAHVLLEHRRLLREALEGHNGRIVDNYGDCFFATFSQPLDAAAAVAAAQRALTGYEWPERVPVKVRMGLHTGEPVAVGGGLVGLDVHRTARICDAAHGGQVLLSKETADLLTASPLEGLEIRDLGDHALKDLTQPERLFQLVIPGVDDEFPAPRSEQASRTPAAERSILVVPRQGDSAERLVEVAVPLAHSVVPHELIVARLVEVAGRTAVDLEEALARATSELHELRASLVGREIGARVAAFTSAAVGEDVVRLASEQAVDLVLLARAKEHLGGGALDSELTTILADSPCDVAVCLLRDEGVEDPDVVLVPFGGGAHDWAALELGAWLASAHGSRLRLLGVIADADTGRRDASRLLAAASLAVQQLVGVPTEPALATAGGEGLVHAALEVDLVVAGMPDDWPDRGLGHARTALAGSDGPTTLFVRRGVRPGGLAPSDNQTRFTWSLSEVRSAG